MDQKEKISYVKALVYVATADNKIDDSERKLFMQLGSMYNLSEDEINNIADSIINKKESLEQILADIKERSVKLLLIYDLIAICYADNNYSIAEKNVMKSITNMLGIEDDKLLEIDNVMKESVSLQSKINKILER